MKKSNLNEFIKVGKVGEVGYFESDDHSKLQSHATAIVSNLKRAGKVKRIKLLRFGAVSESFDEVVKLTRVEILGD